MAVGMDGKDRRGRQVENNLIFCGGRSLSRLHIITYVDLIDSNTRPCGDGVFNMGGRLAVGGARGRKRNKCREIYCLSLWIRFHFGNRAAGPLKYYYTRPHCVAIDCT